MSEFTVTRPFAINTANTTRNVPTAPPAAYDAGTTYATGDTASVAYSISSPLSSLNYYVYESLVDSNTGNTPGSSPNQWKLLGTLYEEWVSNTGGGTYSINDVVWSGVLLYQNVTGTNTDTAPGSDITNWSEFGPRPDWAMFDNSSATQTTWLEEIETVTTVSGAVDSIGAFGLDAALMHINIMEGATEIHDADYSLVDNSMVTGFWEYLFEPIIRKTDIAVNDLPLSVGATVTVTLTGDGMVSAGGLVIGQGRKLGLTSYGASISFTDYSVIQDDVFGGNPGIIERGYNKRGKFNVWVTTAGIDPAYKSLIAYRATAVMITASDLFDSTVYFGLMREAVIEFTGPSHGILSVELRGF